MKELIVSRLLETSWILKSLSENAKLVEKIQNAAMKILEALEKGNKVLFCGNGGSAADAQHLAAELLGKFLIDRSPLPAIALTTNTSVLTAVANDYSFDDVFVRQVKGLGKSGDVLVGISTSGNSRNVLRAIEYAKSVGIFTVGLTGEDGGKMKEFVDVLINVPSKLTPHIQEAHIVIGHIICEIVERQMFGGER